MGVCLLPHAQGLLWKGHPPKRANFLSCKRFKWSHFPKWEISVHDPSYSALLSTNINEKNKSEPVTSRERRFSKLLQKQI